MELRHTAEKMPLKLNSFAAAGKGSRDYNEGDMRNWENAGRAGVAASFTVCLFS